MKNGSAPIDGVWFGNRPPDGEGVYWWRLKLLPILRDRLKLDESSMPPVKKTEIEGFDDAAAPLMQWLATKCHPHHSAIVKATQAELLEGSRIFHTNAYLPD